jgi:hypothetical protein
MSQPSGKTKTLKAQKIKLTAKNPRKIKAALKAWAASSDKMDSDPLKLDEAPQWVENAYVEVVKIVMPSKKLPAAGEWDMELVGELMGRLRAFEKLYSGEIPLGPEQQAELGRLEKFAASQPQSPERAAKEKALTQDLQNMVNATNQAIPQLMDSVLGSSHEDALKFQKGLLRGMSLAPDELTAGKTFQRHTKIFWLLGLLWRSFSKCRSVAEVHRILCQAVGEKQIGSLKTFENRVAKKIGMRFGRSGRPPKSK